MDVTTRILWLLVLLALILFSPAGLASSTDFRVSATVETVIGVKTLVRQPMGILVASSEDEHYELLLAMGDLERKFSNAVDEKTINGKRYWVAHDNGGSLQILPFIGGGGVVNVRIESELDLLPVLEKELIYNVEAQPGEIYITVTPARDEGGTTLESDDIREYRTASVH